MTDGGGFRHVTQGSFKQMFRTRQSRKPYVSVMTGLAGFLFLSWVHS